MASFNCLWTNVTFPISPWQEVNIQRVKTGMKANLPTPELAQLMISMLDQLIVDVK